MSTLEHRMKRFRDLSATGQARLLSALDAGTRAYFVLHNADSALRLQCVPHLNDDYLLTCLARQDADESVRAAAIAQLPARNQDVLFDVAQNDASSALRVAATARLHDAAFLMRLIHSANSPECAVEQMAVKRLPLRELVHEVVLTTPNPAVRRAAVARTLNEDVLEHVAVRDADVSVRRAAIEALESEETREILREKLRHDLTVTPGEGEQLCAQLGAAGDLHHRACAKLDDILTNRILSPELRSRVIQVLCARMETPVLALHNPALEDEQLGNCNGNSAAARLLAHIYRDADTTPADRAAIEGLDGIIVAYGETSGFKGQPLLHRMLFDAREKNGTRMAT